MDSTSRDHRRIDSSKAGLCNWCNRTEDMTYLPWDATAVHPDRRPLSPTLLLRLRVRMSNPPHGSAAVRCQLCVRPEPIGTRCTIRKMLKYSTAYINMLLQIEVTVVVLKQRNSPMNLSPEVGHRIACSQGDLRQPEHARILRAEFRMRSS